MSTPVLFKLNLEHMYTFPGSYALINCLFFAAFVNTGRAWLEAVQPLLKNSLSSSCLSSSRAFGSEDIPAIVPFAIM